MKLINIALEIRDAEKYFDLANQQEWADLKITIPQLIRNVTQDEIILYACNYGTLHAVKEGSRIFTKSNERIGVQISDQPTNGEKWRLETTDNPQSVYIRNIFTKEYLYQTNKLARETYPDSRQVFLASNLEKAEFKWILKYLNQGFYIINSRNSHYLFTEGLDNDNMHIMTTNSVDKWSTFEC